MCNGLMHRDNCITTRYNSRLVAARIRAVTLPLTVHVVRLFVAPRVAAMAAQLHSSSDVAGLARAPALVHGALVGIATVGVTMRLLPGVPGLCRCSSRRWARRPCCCSRCRRALAQPWSIIGGNLVAATVGVACAQWIADPVTAAAVAIACAIGGMFMLRCVHPPSAPSRSRPWSAAPRSIRSGSASCWSRSRCIGRPAVGRARLSRADRAPLPARRRASRSETAGRRCRTRAAASRAATSMRC